MFSGGNSGGNSGGPPLNVGSNSEFSMQSFGEDFDLFNFLESVTAETIRTHDIEYPVDNAKSDPQRFEKLFGFATNQLKDLKTKVHDKLSVLTKEYNDMDLKRKSAEENVSSLLNGISDSFSTLNDKISSIGQTAIKVGERIDVLDTQLKRAQNAKELMVYFKDFTTGKTQRLDDIQDSDSFDGEYAAAVIARRLLQICEEDIPEARQTYITTERYCEELELQQLERFDAAHKRKDYRTMNKCARILYAFNGGSTCVKSYINQCEFFMNSDKIGDFNMSNYEENDKNNKEGDESNKRVPDVYEEDKCVPNNGLIELFEEVWNNLQDEWEVIQMVFPNPIIVLSQLAQRMFAQPIQTYIEKMLDKAKSVSTLSFLQLLTWSKIETKQLVDSLAALDPNQSSSYITGVASTPFYNIISRANEDIFIQYLDGDKYLDIERDSLQKICNLSFGPLITFIGIKPDFFFSSWRKPNLETASVSTGAQSPSITSPLSPSGQSVASYIGYENISSKYLQDLLDMGDSLSRKISTIVSKEDKVVNENNPGNCTIDIIGIIEPQVDLLHEVFKQHLAAIHRMKELLPTSQHSKEICTLLWLLIESVGKNFILAYLAYMSDLTHSLDFKNNANIPHLTVMKVAEKFLQLLQLHFHIDIVPVVSSVNAVHREAVARKNAFTVEVENSCNLLVQRHIAAIENHITQQLYAKQGKSDYCIGNDYDNENVDCTACCNYICTFLTSIHTEAALILDSVNLKAFITEIGISLHSYLLEHYRKYVINQTGALVLMRDLAKYHTTITEFQIPVLNERFEMLREIGNLFLFKVDNLPNVLTEGYLSRVDATLLMPYMKMREDWSTVNQKDKSHFQESRRVVSSI